MANLSGIPQSTIRNFLNGTNAGFGNVAKLAISLGGDLNELIGYEKKKEIEVNSTVSMKETYEMRIADIINSYESRIADIKELCNTRIEDVMKCCEARIADIRKIYEDRLREIQAQR
jgi:vacuolar-type H+-ATPase subunit I/STV1